LRLSLFLWPFSCKDADGRPFSLGAPALTGGLSFFGGFLVGGDDDALAGLFRGDDRRLLLLLPLLSRFSLLLLFGVPLSGFDGVDDSLAPFFLASVLDFFVLPAPPFLAALPGFSPLRTRLTASAVSIC
jgi:hypothetical protein